MIAFNPSCLFDVLSGFASFFESVEQIPTMSHTHV